MNSHKSSRRIVFPALVISIVLAILLSLTAQAQTTGNFTLSKPDVSRYPEISTTFAVTDLNGRFVKDLTPAEIQVMENGSVATVNSLELVQKGVRFYAAVNEGRTLGNRYKEISRFDRLRTHLTEWVNTHSGETSDEFHLFSNQVTLDIDAADPASWKKALESYTPDLLKSKASLSSLTSAVNRVVNDGQTDDTAAALLYITPLPTAQEVQSIKDLLMRAAGSGAHIFLWLIGPPEYSNNELAGFLQQYTTEAGGSYLLYSGAEVLPSISDLLDPFSYTYSLTYTSQQTASGDYKLQVKIQRSNLYLESDLQDFSLTVMPPNPIFLSPPSEIVRTWTETKKVKDSVLTPDSTKLTLMVEFPDGYERDLVLSQLWVDGKIASQNTVAPFDVFSLDLGGYTSSSEHNLKAVVKDSLGLEGETIEIPVSIQVAKQSLSPLQKFITGINAVNGTIAGFFLLMLVSGVAAIVHYGRQNRLRKKQERKVDPLTQSVEIPGEYTLTPARVEKESDWPVIRGVGLAPARLRCQTGKEDGTGKFEDVPLSGKEITIGSDARKADVVILHASVSGAHARIYKDAQGDFHLADAASSTGTWLNYAPVSSAGAKLEHGDLVQFGRVGYVFEAHGAVPRRVQVLPYKED